jgi:hypothetical protein
MRIVQPTWHNDIPRLPVTLTFACGCEVTITLPRGGHFERLKAKKLAEARQQSCPDCKADRLPSRPKPTDDDERWYDGAWRRKSV